MTFQPYTRLSAAQLNAVEAKADAAAALAQSANTAAATAAAAAGTAQSTADSAAFAAAFAVPGSSTAAAALADADGLQVRQGPGPSAAWLRATLGGLAAYAIGTAKAFLASGTGAVARAAQDKMRDALSVKDYGAKGDGSTDDTDAIQAAINAASAALRTGYYGPTVGCVAFPAGDYRIRGIDVPPRVGLLGAGKNCTSLTMRGNQNRSAVKFLKAPQAQSTPYNDFDQSVMRGFTVYHDSSANTLGHGIEFEDPGYSLGTHYGVAAHLTDVVVVGAPENGIHAADNRNFGTLLNVTVRSSKLAGLHLRGYDWRVTDCDFGSSGTDGIVVGAGGAHQFSGCNVYSNKGSGVFAYGNNWLMFSNCTISSNDQRGVIVGNDSGLMVHLVNCRLAGNSRDNTDPAWPYPVVEVVGNRPVSLVGCHFLAQGNPKASHIVKHLNTGVGLSPVYVAGCHWPIADATNVPYSVAAFSHPEWILGAVAQEDVAGTSYATRIGVAGSATGELRANGDLPVLAWKGVASAVTYLSTQNAAGTNPARFTVESSQTNAGLDLYAKGTSFIRLRNANGVGMVVQSPTASGNYLKAIGAASGSDAILAVEGDTNASLRIGAAGTGTVKMIAPLLLQGFAFASLPSAATYSGCMIRVTDRSSRPATSDGTNWRFADGTVVT